MKLDSRLQTQTLTGFLQQAWEMARSFSQNLETIFLLFIRVQPRSCCAIRRNAQLSRYALMVWHRFYAAQYGTMEKWSSEHHYFIGKYHSKSRATQEGVSSFLTAALMHDTGMQYNLCIWKFLVQAQRMLYITTVVCQCWHETLCEMSVNNTTVLTFWYGLRLAFYPLMWPTSSSIVLLDRLTLEMTYGLLTLTYNIPQ